MDFLTKYSGEEIEKRLNKINLYSDEEQLDFTIKLYYDLYNEYCTLNSITMENENFNNSYKEEIISIYWFDSSYFVVKSINIIHSFALWCEIKKTLNSELNDENITEYYFNYDGFMQFVEEYKILSVLDKIPLFIDINVDNIDMGKINKFIPESIWPNIYLEEVIENKLFDIKIFLELTESLYKIITPEFYHYKGKNVDKTQEIICIGEIVIPFPFFNAFIHINMNYFVAKKSFDEEHCTLEFKQ